VTPEWNLLLVVIQNSIEALPPPGVHITYVKGHQDNTTPYHLLPLQALLNVEADSELGNIRDRGDSTIYLYDAAIHCN
jgi:hypothetical protein